MSVRNLNWYALNEQRGYPFDDQATLIDDNNNKLDPGYITDLFLRFPKAAGEYAFLSGFSCTDTIATGVFVASDGSNFTPLAAISVAQPVVKGRHYRLQSIYPGAGGWIVFGSRTSDRKPCSLRFSSLDQSKLLARIARSYNSLPVEGIKGGDSLTPLTGLVRLLGGNDIEVVLEDRVINGITRDAIVIRLKDKLGGSGQLDRNIYADYLGACGRRPESDNCGDPPPIEFINSVKPDCCGNITLELQGCGFFVPISELCGIVVTCDFGLADACVTKDRLPGIDGKLANEYLDLCLSFSSSIPAPEEEEEIPSYSEPDNDSDAEVDNLPYDENFDGQSADDFTVINGDFTFVLDDPGNEPTTSSFSGSAFDVSWSTESVSGLAQRNLAIWSSGIPEQNDWTTVFKRVEVGLYMDTGPAGCLHNGGIVFNHKDLSGSDSYVHWTAELDWDGSFGSGAKMLRIAKYNGTNYDTLLATKISNLTLETWLKMTLTLFDAGNEDAAWAILQLDSLTGPSIASSVGPVYLPGYHPTTGLFGLTSYRSPTRFGYIYVTNETP